MKDLTILFAAVLILFSGCSRPAAKTSAGEITPAAVKTGNCPEYFYFYNQEKVPLTITPNLIMVGFAGKLTQAQKLEVLRRFPEFVRFQADDRSEGTTPFNMIELQNNTTCSQALQIMKELQQQELISYANPVFQAPSLVGSGHRWAGVTSEFIVTLKSTSTEADLTKLMAGTNTRKKDDLGNNTYLLEATKTSKGNALEMANYFHGQAAVQNAEPDLYMAGRPGE